MTKGNLNSGNEEHQKGKKNGLSFESKHQVI